MATRFYLPRSLSAEIGTVAYDAGWQNVTSAARRPLPTVQQGISLNSVATSPTATSPELHLLRQGVSSPMAAQTISGTVKWVQRCRENTSGVNATLAMLIKVVSNDGLTTRGVLLPMTYATVANVPAAELNPGGTFNSRRFYDDAGNVVHNLTPVVCQDGDRLVVEQGVRDQSTDITNPAYLVFGDSAAQDLPDVDGDTNIYNSWVEFSHNVVWQGQQVVTGWGFGSDIIQMGKDWGPVGY